MDIGNGVGVGVGVTVDVTVGVGVLVVVSEGEGVRVSEGIGVTALPEWTSCDIAGAMGLLRPQAENMKARIRSNIEG